MTSTAIPDALKAKAREVARKVVAGIGFDSEEDFAAQLDYAEPLLEAFALQVRNEAIAEADERAAKIADTTFDARHSWRLRGAGATIAAAIRARP